MFFSPKFVAGGFLFKDVDSNKIDESPHVQPEKVVVGLVGRLLKSQFIEVPVFRPSDSLNGKKHAMMMMVIVPHINAISTLSIVV